MKGLVWQCFLTENKKTGQFEFYLKILLGVRDDPEVSTGRH